MAAYPKKCAQLLGKPVIETFTGHTFRRTSATIVADSGASLMALKRHGRWASDRVAQRYVSESKRSKMEVSDMISGKKEEIVAATSVGSASNASGAFSFGSVVFNNCVVNLSN